MQRSLWGLQVAVTSPCPSLLGVLLGAGVSNELAAAAVGSVRGMEFAAVLGSGLFLKGGLSTVDKASSSRYLNPTQVSCLSSLHFLLLTLESLCHRHLCHENSAEAGN